jgi:uncharacterized membrane protein YhhN
MIDKEDLFIQGMCTFALTHIMYIMAFLSMESFNPYRVFAMLSSIMIFAISLFLYKLLSKKMSKLMKIGMLIYILLESSMVSMTIAQSISGITFLAAIGGMGFLTCDLIIGWTTFRPDFRASDYLIWFTYGLGQYLIALSIVLR